MLDKTGVGQIDLGKMFVLAMLLENQASLNLQNRNFFCFFLQFFRI